MGTNIHVPSLRPPRSRRDRRKLALVGDSKVFRDDRGWTALHIASHKGDLAQVNALLKRGLNVNEPSHGPKYPGATALHLAAGAGHVDVMDVLLENGANIEARTRGCFGWTPLHQAAKSNKVEAMRFLIDCGAFISPELSDPRFNPPLHYFRGLLFAQDHATKSSDESSTPADSSSDYGGSIGSNNSIASLSLESKAVLAELERLQADALQGDDESGDDRLEDA